MPVSQLLLVFIYPAALSRTSDSELLTTDSDCRLLAPTTDYSTDY